MKENKIIKKETPNQKLKTQFNQYQRDHKIKTDKDINFDVNPYDTKTIWNFLKVENEEQLDENIRRLFYVILRQYDELALDEVIKYISGKFDKSKRTLQTLKTNVKKNIDFEEQERTKEDKKLEKKEEKEKPQTSLVVGKNIIAEQVYDGGTSKFCVYNVEDDKISYVSEFDGYEPINAQEIIKEAIFLPTKAEEYGTDEKLDKNIKEFINKWLDIPEDMLLFAVWNIKRSWVFERFHTLNYLRALGDTGQGKTRFLDTLGYLHYKPIATSGATTSAPVFRIIDKWKGTLIMDEADLKKSDEAQDIIKIINQGYERGKYVMRCDQNNAKNIDFFDPFCPKVLATRKSFYDKATESRCITQVMIGTTREDIKFNLDKDFFGGVLDIRNKLLMWRFRNYFKIEPNKEVDFGLKDIEPRVQQIVNSFVSLFINDKEQLEKFKVFIEKYQDDLREERRNTFVGGVVESIYNLIENEEFNINNQDIIDKGALTNMEGKPLKPRGLSTTLKGLGFKKPKPKKVDGTTKRCLVLEDKHLKELFKRHGYKVTKVTVLGGELQKKINVETQVGEGGAPSPLYRNLRNQSNPNVTEELVQNDPPEIKFIQSFGKSGCQTQAFVERWGEARMRELLKKGDIYENKPGILKTL